jgi:uncharacterized protein
MNPIEIIAEYYAPTSKAFETLIQHGKQVAQKALACAGKVAALKPDHVFLENAAMLHDIGIFMTNSFGFGCRGRHPYICHGVLGAQLLRDRGLPDYALVCERHVGVGISAEDVRYFSLPLPDRDMLPVSMEEQIICYADKFFSKNGNDGGNVKTIAQITRDLKSYGNDKVVRFQKWVNLFE